MNEEQIRKILSGRTRETILPVPWMRAAVLIPLLKKDGEFHVLFEVRSSRVDQAGEISFPGGHIEPGETAAKAAVRETAEELLLREDQVELLFPMHRLPAAGTMSIDSYLGILHGYEDSWDENEVESTFTVPLSWLLSYEPKIYHGGLRTRLGEDFPYEDIPGGRNYPFFEIPRAFYFYYVGDKVIWGFTAELLYRFLEALKAPGTETAL